MKPLACTALLCLVLSARGAEPPPDCLPGVSVPMLASIAGPERTPALLQGGSGTPLRLVRDGSGELLWSGGAGDTVVQPLAGMDAGFSGSFAAIDLDGDGRQDRIYAGDMAARVWRIDLRHGAAAADWASARLLADFSNTQGRLFLAAPDVSLSTQPALPAWLTLVIGTASPSNPSTANRIYVLHDSLEEDAGDGHYPPPLVEADLRRVSTLAEHQNAQAAPDGPIGPGWFLELPAGHVLSPSLTLHGRSVLAIARSLPRDGSCEIFARILTLDLQRRDLLRGEDRAWSTTLPHPVHSADAFTLGSVENGIAPCMLGGQRVPACDVDTRVRRLWWRRQDAP